ncbi:unnamed protein product [Arabidopsis halleri]
MTSQGRRIIRRRRARLYLGNRERMGGGNVKEEASSSSERGGRGYGRTGESFPIYKPNCKRRSVKKQRSRSKERPCKEERVNRREARFGRGEQHGGMANEFG